MNSDLPIEEIEALELSPVKNDKVITLLQMPDGNWRGFTQRNGKLTQARQIDPQTVLVLLQTAE